MAAAELRAQGATPEEMVRRHGAWARLFEGRSPPRCTPQALAKFWGKLAAPAPQDAASRLMAEAVRLREEETGGRIGSTSPGRGLAGGLAFP